MRGLTLASLFDGIGGFPLCAVRNGVTPVWASEIEPFPIMVTRKRFPQMQHYGDVSKICGTDVPPVDIITFGSPCQDLSVAGKQAGIHEGARSSLFFEAVRIIKEMRASAKADTGADETVRPARWAVWENVPGAYSSHGGRDFQAVLQALASVKDPDAVVPLPPKGKWQNAGCIVGDGYSVAWRTYDAQYWPGTPQRRKRIYLVADFDGERAGEILFEREGRAGHSEPGEAAREGTAGDAAAGAGRDDRVRCLNPWDSQSFRQYSIEGAYAPLDVREASGGRAQGIVYSVLGNVCDRNSNQNGCGWSEGNAPTLNTVDRHAVVYEPTVCIKEQHQFRSAGIIDNIGGKREKGQVTETAPCIKATHCKMPPVICARAAYAAAFMGGHGEKAHGIGWSETIAQTLKSAASGTNTVPDVVYAIEGDGNTRAHIAKNLSPCMKTVHVNTVVYDARGNGNGAIAPTITDDHNNRVTDYSAICVGNGQANQLNMGNRAGALNCMHDQQIVIHSAPQPRRYIARRLTPLECCRLQGYPDGWTEGMIITDPSEEEISFWMSVWRDWAEINDKKPKSRSGVIKWMQNAGSDSAEYKAYGNSIAIPCANDVIRRIAEFAKKEATHEHTQRD